MGPEKPHLKFRDLLRLSVRTFRVKPIRAILTILGMSIGIGVVMFLVSLGYGLQYILIGNLVTTQDSIVTMEASYASETGLALHPDDIQALRALPNVAEVAPVADFYGDLSLAGATSSANQAVVDVQVVPPSYFRLSGTSVNAGTTFSSTTQGIVVTSQALALQNLATSSASLGKQFNIQLTYEDTQTGASTLTESTGSLPIVGIILDDTRAPTVILPPDAVKTPPPFYTSALVKAQDLQFVEPVRDALISKGLTVSARIDLVNQARQITNVITMILGVFGVTALIVSAIGMFNTMIVSFMERTYEVGVLKSIGATDSDVRNLFLMESAIMGLAGGGGGILLGVGGGQLMNFILNIVAQHLGGKAFTLFITPVWFAGMTLGFSIVIGLTSGFVPARRASLLSPKEAFLRK